MSSAEISTDMVSFTIKEAVSDWAARIPKFALSFAVFELLQV